MGSTNSTVNYSLSQFIGTDKPSWLNDYDNDMFKIDAQMKLNATAAAGAKTTADTAEGKADANALAISTLDSQINTAGTGLAAQVSANTTAIGTIDGEIGNTPLTTVSQTLTGAIEEVKASIPDVTRALVFSGTNSVSVNADGTKTFGTLLNELHAALITYISSKTSSYIFQLSRLLIPGQFSSNVDNLDITGSSFNSTITADSINLSDTDTLLVSVKVMAANSTLVRSYNGTLTDFSNTAMASGSITLYFNEFTLL